MIYVIKPNYQQKSLIIDCKFNLNPIMKVLSIYLSIRQSVTVTTHLVVLRAIKSFLCIYRMLCVDCKKYI